MFPRNPGGVATPSSPAPTGNTPGRCILEMISTYGPAHPRKSRPGEWRLRGGGATGGGLRGWGLGGDKAGKLKSLDPAPWAFVQRLWWMLSQLGPGWDSLCARGCEPVSSRGASGCKLAHPHPSLQVPRSRERQPPPPTVGQFQRRLEWREKEENSGLGCAVTN